MTTGFNNTLKNVGAMNNRGIELDMNYDVFNETAVKWSTGIVLSHNKTRSANCMEEKTSLAELPS